MSPRDLSRIFPQTGVDVQRATASLGSGDGDFAAILAEHPNGGVIQAREADICDATGQERYAITLGVFGLQHFSVMAKGERNFDLRRKALHVAQSARQKTKHPDEFLNTAGLVKIEQRSENSEVK